MRATLQWSYDLLSPHEQQLFRQQSVFAGGWTLAAAEGVAGSADALALLGSLVDKGLARRVDRDGQPTRYGMLEPVRQFAWECLGEDPSETSETRQRHADYYQSIVKGLRARVDSPDGPEVFERIEAEHDNLRAALRWLQESNQIEQSLRLAHEMLMFWIQRGYVGEGLAQLDALLRLPGASQRTIGRSRALWSISWLLYSRGEVQPFFPLIDEARAISEELEDEIGLADALFVRGIYHHQSGDAAKARCDYECALSLFRKLGETAMVVRASLHLGLLAHGQGESERSRMLMEEGLALARTGRLKIVLALALGSHAAIAERSGNDHRIAELLEERLTLYYELGAPRGIAESLVFISMLLHRQGQSEPAACFLGVAAALRERTGYFYSAATELVSPDEALDTLRATLSDAAVEAAWTRGRQMPLDEAIERVHQALTAIHTAPRPTLRAGLTPREAEVLGLIAAGKSNRQMAAEMFLSTRTVERHITNIYNKIGAHNRAGATAFALSNGLSNPAST